MGYVAARSGARAASQAEHVVMPRLSPTLRRVFRAPVYLYRWKCGWLLGHRFLLLIHVGRRTGLRHQTVLEIMAYRQDPLEWVVMSGFGREADWFRNIEAARGADILVGSRRIAVAHRVLPAAEAGCVIAGYERRNRLLAPIVRNVLSRLAGWRYDGSEPARRRLAAQLPLVAFRPH
jgi:deazaflavin-dependent oxidoreductase (nitroreductase family)